MTSEKIVDGVKYISTKKASEITAYAADYIGQLCRASKIPCIRQGRTWMVSEDAILHYTKPVEKPPKRAYTKRKKAHIGAPVEINKKSSEVHSVPPTIAPELSPKAPALTIIAEATELDNHFLKELNPQKEISTEISAPAKKDSNKIPLHVLTPTPAEVREIKKEEGKHDLSHSKFTKIKIDAVPQKYVHHFPEASIVDKLRVYGSHSIAFLLLMIAFAFSMNTVAQSSIHILADSKELFSYDNILDATALDSGIVKDALSGLGETLSAPLAAVYDAVKPETTFPKVPEPDLHFYNLAPRHQTPLDTAVNNISVMYK